MPPADPLVPAGLRRECVLAAMLPCSHTERELGRARPHLAGELPAWLAGWVGAWHQILLDCEVAGAVVILLGAAVVASGDGVRGVLRAACCL